MQATLTSARPFQTGMPAAEDGPTAALRGATRRKRALRAAAAIGVAAAGMVLAPMATAFADDSEYVSPAAPIFRQSDRGYAMSGVGDERVAEKGAVLGGTTSGGAPILINDGNAAPLPEIFNNWP